MAETYSVPGTPRVYIDNVLFARSIGMPLSVTTGSKLLWDMDPVRTTNYQLGEVLEIHSELLVPTASQGTSNGFSDLLSTSNYVGVLNHNLFTGGNTVTVRLEANNVDITPDDNVGSFSSVSSDGFMLADIDIGETLVQFDFRIRDTNWENGGLLSPSHNYNIGCFSLGTYLDFPVSPDLNVKMGYSHEGVQSKRTIAGKDLTHVSYSGSPNWGDLPPFTIKDDDNDTINFSGAGLTGRKTWDMKFSYVDKTDMFNAIQSGSSAGTYTSGGFAETSSIIGTYLSRTLGGKLKHVLQPNRDKNEFYMVKLDQKSTSITQVAHGVFEISFKFVQVW
mgnify:CR=1 FL=1|tara:strand:+ start:1112 stop:2113 length:1002 start_codon:yes stop_codon:yes gene_type:complete